MGFRDAIRAGFQNYAVFTGRTRRSAYWYWILFTLLCQIALGVADVGIFGHNSRILQSLFTLATLLPTLAVTARRLHDTDRSGWWMLVGLVPMVGFIVLLVLTLIEGTAGPNRFGPDPLRRPARGPRRAGAEPRYRQSSIPRVRRDGDQ